MQDLKHMFHDKLFQSDWIIMPKSRRNAGRRLAPARGLRKAWAKSREDQMKLAKIALLGLALAVAASVVSPAMSQQAEPPKSFAAKLKAKYHEKREKYLARVKQLYFAVGCKVLTSEAGIVPLTSSESYLAYIGDQTIVDVRDEDMRKAAAQEGLDRASRPGECDYYRRHPEAAEAARRAAAEAAKP
jgi:hypothetical protein